MATNPTLHSQFVNASKWSALTEIASKAITPIAYLILTYFLTPEDFGIVAIATILISFSQVFWDAGLSKALIQRQHDIEKVCDIVFWTNILLSIAIYTLLFLTAEFISLKFNKQKEVELVIQIQAILIILLAFSSVHTSLFQRNLNFKSLFYLRLFTSAIPIIISIPLAFVGLGYWALVIGTLLGGIFQVIALLKISPWRPRFTYDGKIAIQLFSFGLWVTGENLLTVFFRWLDTSVVGIYLGVNILGLYQTGNTFITAIYGLFLSPILPVLYSIFSKIRHNKDLFFETFFKTNKIISMIALPIGCGLFALNESLSILLFDEKWAGIAQIIGWIGLANGLSWMVAANSEAYRSIGRPDISTKIMLIAACIYLPLQLFAIQFGLKFFLAIRLLLTLFGTLIHLYFSKKYLNYGFTIFIFQYKYIIISSSFMMLILLIMDKYIILNANIIINTIFQIIIGIIVYITAIYKEWPFILKIIKNLTLDKK